MNSPAIVPLLVVIGGGVSPPRGSVRSLAVAPLLALPTRRLDPAARHLVRSVLCVAAAGSSSSAALGCSVGEFCCCTVAPVSPLPCTRYLSWCICSFVPIASVAATHVAQCTRLLRLLTWKNKLLLMLRRIPSSPYVYMFYCKPCFVNMSNFLCMPTTCRCNTYTDMHFFQFD